MYTVVRGPRLPQHLDRLAELLLDEVGFQSVGGREEVVRFVVLIPGVGLPRDAKLFHADLTCTYLEFVRGI